jgi:type I restriction enzyme S subunit
MPRAQWSVIRKKPISVPLLSEQQKIAAFLTVVDERFGLLKRKKELLEEYKKGVMQRLFSREIRFKDEEGNEYPEWEEKRLGEVLRKTSSSFSMNDLREKEGPYEVYGATGIVGYCSDFQIVDAYIGIVKDGAGVGRIVMCKENSSVLGTLDILQPTKHSKLSFMFQLLKTIQFRHYITGSTIPHIYFKDYSKLKISIPSIAEQHKIASFLTDIDKKTEAVSNCTERLSEFKMGLLQKIFV